MSGKKEPIADRCRNAIVNRRARGQSVADIAAYAVHCVRSFRLSVAYLQLTLPEAVIFHRTQKEIDERQAKRRDTTKRQPPQAAVMSSNSGRSSLPKRSLTSTAVLERLGCTRTELNRWADDGRLPPDGERSTMLGGSYHRWLRAWLPETVEAAAPNIVVWREQDAVKRQFNRSGLKVLAG